MKTRKDIYKTFFENGVKREELAVINIKHDHHDVPSPVDRTGIHSWHFIYHKPKPVVEEQEDWFMNLIIRDLDRDLLGK